MTPFTYRKLLSQLENLTDEQLDSQVMACDASNHYSPALGIYYAQKATKQNRLTINQPYFVTGC